MSMTSIAHKHLRAVPEGVNIVSRSTILCIEYPPAMVELIRRILDHEGIDVCFQSTGDEREGVKLARQEKPDLILLGVQLREGDGWEVLERIRGDDELKRIPVVMLAQPVPPGVDRTLSKSMPDVSLTKPFSPQELVEAIRRVLHTRNG